MVQSSASSAAFILVLSLGITIQLCVFLPYKVVEAIIFSSSTCRPASNGDINKLLIIGLGGVGLQVADLAIEEEEAIQIFGTVRKSSMNDREINALHGNCLETKEIVKVLFDPVCVRKHLFGCEDNKKTDESSITAATHVLFTIPLSKENDLVMKAVLRELREWWETTQENNGGSMDSDSDKGCDSKVLGIVSTTGVYGNHDGEVVKESSKRLCEETSNADLYRRFEDEWITLTGNDGGVKVEVETQSNNNGSHCRRRLCIFRCAGIYDSSRSALHTVYKNLAVTTRANSSSPPTKSGNKTNRIHARDLARGVLSGMFQKGNHTDDSGVGIYNLADNLPEERSVVLSYARELLSSIGIDQRKSRTEAATNPVASNDRLLSRSSTTRQKRRERESKLVSNQRLREELLQKDGLLFPTYREGLCAILNDPSTPWQQDQREGSN
mmetsp:Transcript_1133/g.2552  ORF Transcript_1133/g.2552 Transcript_1133/m.2552 type:complete len:441 (+) Transcript_1133:141-1463(+)